MPKQNGLAYFAAATMVGQKIIKVCQNQSLEQLIHNPNVKGSNLATCTWKKIDNFFKFPFVDYYFKLKFMSKVDIAIIQFNFKVVFFCLETC